MFLVESPVTSENESSLYMDDMHFTISNCMSAILILEMHSIWNCQIVQSLNSWSCSAAGALSTNLHTKEIAVFNDWHFKSVVWWSAFPNVLYSFEAMNSFHLECRILKRLTISVHPVHCQQLFSVSEIDKIWAPSWAKSLNDAIDSWKNLKTIWW